MMHGLKKMNRNGELSVLGGYFVHVLFIQLLSDSLLTVSMDLIRYIALLVISILCYIAAFTVGGVLFIWFNPSGHDCSLNVFFMVMSLILPVIFTGVALHPKVRTTSLSYEVFPCAVSDMFRSKMLSCNISFFVLSHLRNQTGSSCQTIIIRSPGIFFFGNLAS